jgi:hypothetical protein
MLSEVIEVVSINLLASTRMRLQRSLKEFLNSIPIQTPRLLLLAALLLLAGHLLPWATHSTAALTLSANELGFFTNDTPHAGIVANEWFYAPMWVCALLLAGLAGYAGRPSALALGGFAALLALPRYESLQKMMHGQPTPFAAQLWLTLLVIALGLALVWAVKRRNLKPTPRFQGMGLVAGLAGCAALCAVTLGAYIAIKPALEGLYNGAVGIGLGWWLTLCGDLLLWLSTFAKISVARIPHRPRQRLN